MTLQEIEAKSPYQDYDELITDLQDLIVLEEAEQIKYDPRYTSYQAALKRLLSDQSTIYKTSYEIIHGIVLKVENVATGFKKIWIDVPIAKNTTPIVHPDYFDESNPKYNIKEFDHIIFYAETIDLQNSCPPIRGGIARVKIDQNFPDSNRKNVYIDMASNKTAFVLAEEIPSIATTEPEISAEKSSTGEQVRQQTSEKILTVDDVRTVNDLYKNLTFGSKFENNDTVKRIKRDIIKKLMEYEDLEFRRDAANLVGLSWQNDYYVTINNSFRGDDEQAVMYVGGRYCKKTEKIKYYDVIALPLYSSHSLMMAIDINGLEGTKFRNVTKDKYPFKQLNNKINEGYSLGLTWMGRNNGPDTVHWGYDGQERMYTKRDKVWKSQGLNNPEAVSNRVIEYIKNAVRHHYFKNNAELFDTPQNINHQQAGILKNNKWWREFKDSLVKKV